MRRFMACTVLVAATMSASSTAGAGTCFEDEPCWDAATMGNGTGYRHQDGGWYEAGEYTGPAAESVVEWHERFAEDEWPTPDAAAEADAAAHQAAEAALEGQATALSAMLDALARVASLRLF